MTTTELPWQPWERNFSGGRIGVQEQQEANENWIILHVESGGVKTTTSLRQHEAWMLAQMISPQLEAERQRVFAEYRAQRDALYAFEWMGTEADLLRTVADEWSCGDGCEYAGYGSCPQLERDGCKFAEADGLRGLAAAIDLVAQAIEARSGETGTGSTEGDSAGRQASPDQSGAA